MVARTTRNRPRPDPEVPAMLRHRSVLVLACAATLAIAAPAAAATYRVAGKQVAVDADAGLAAMHGGLIGDWATTSFELVEVSPLARGRGTETFDGCLNRNRRDRSCKGDPAGTLALTFDYVGAFGSPDPASLIWGRACTRSSRVRAPSPARRA